MPKKSTVTVEDNPVILKLSDYINFILNNQDEFSLENLLTIVRMIVVEVRDKRRSNKIIRQILRSNVEKFRRMINKAKSVEETLEAVWYLSLVF